jgi:hypothetical protein
MMVTFDGSEPDGTFYYRVSQDVLWRMSEFLRRVAVYTGNVSAWVFYDLGDWQFEVCETCLRAAGPDDTTVVFDVLQ